MKFTTNRYWHFKNVHFLLTFEHILKHRWLAIVFTCLTDLTVIGREGHRFTTLYKVQKLIHRHWSISAVFKNVLINTAQILAKNRTFFTISVPNLILLTTLHRMKNIWSFLVVRVNDWDNFSLTNLIISKF